jgi:hypothetical protein
MMSGAFDRRLSWRAVFAWPSPPPSAASVLLADEEARRRQLDRMQGPVPRRSQNVVTAVSAPAATVNPGSDPTVRLLSRQAEVEESGGSRRVVQVHCGGDQAARPEGLPRGACPLVSASSGHQLQ